MEIQPIIAGCVPSLDRAPSRCGRFARITNLFNCRRVGYERTRGLENRVNIYKLGQSKIGKKAFKAAETFHTTNSTAQLKPLISEPLNPLIKTYYSYYQVALQDLRQALEVQSRKGVSAWNHQFIQMEADKLIYISYAISVLSLQEWHETEETILKPTLHFYETLFLHHATYLFLIRMPLVAEQKIFFPTVEDTRIGPDFLKWRKLYNELNFELTKNGPEYHENLIPQLSFLKELL